MIPVCRPGIPQNSYSGPSFFCGTISFLIFSLRLNFSLFAIRGLRILLGRRRTSPLFFMISVLTLRWILRSIYFTSSLRCSSISLAFSFLACFFSFIFSTSSSQRCSREERWSDALLLPVGCLACSSSSALIYSEYSLFSLSEHSFWQSTFRFASFYKTLVLPYLLLASRFASFEVDCVATDLCQCSQRAKLRHV